MQANEQAVRHRQDFEREYSKCPSGDNHIRFPLLDIYKSPFLQKEPESRRDYIVYMYRRFSAHILSMMELEDGQDILSLGCGLGHDEKNIKELCPGSRLWSTDISEEMVRRAKVSLSPSRFSVATAEALPFPDACFDRVVSREVIEHVMDPSAMIYEIARVLKPGGIAVITTENERTLALPNDIIQEAREKYGRMIGSPLPPHGPAYKDEAPTPDAVEAMARLAGLGKTSLIFDGALYHTLNRLSLDAPHRDYVSLAHRLSALENGRLARLLCDQYKIALCKPDSAEPVNEPAYSVPGGGLLLVDDGEKLVDPESGVFYPVADGVPDFVGVPEIEEKIVRKTPPPRNTDGVLRRAAVELDRFFVRKYPWFLCLVGCLASFVLSGNRKVMSRQLGKHPDFGAYIALSLGKKR